MNLPMNLLINESPLQVLPSLANKIGLNEAMVLQQIHYWLNPKHNKNFHDGVYWVYNTYEQWQKQFPFFSEKTIRRIIGRLEELGLILSVAKYGFQKTKFYTINYGKLETLNTLPDAQLTGQNDQTHLPKRADTPGQVDRSHVDKMTRCIYTETTTEITLPPHITSPAQMGDQQQEDEEEEFKNMILIWNKIRPDQQLFLTAARRESLSRFNQEFVKASVITWQAYCDKIAGSRFLMGENTTGFKVQLDWALKRENIYKILEGAIYDKPAVAKAEALKELSPEELVDCLEPSFPEGTMAEPWKVVLRRLAEKLGSFTVKAWFENAGLMAIEDTEAVLLTDKRYRADWIRNRYDLDLERALKTVYPQIKSFRFNIRGQK